MKLFLKKILLFLFIPSAFLLIGIMLPPTPRAKMSLLRSATQKDSLLANVKGPRIIFVSGSSMGFGLNSQTIKDSLHRNPINTGIHGGIGLYYMLDNTAKYIQKGDVVVLAPEYHQFYGNFCQGSVELLRVIMDNSKHMDYLKLRRNQIMQTSSFIPRYALSKFVPSQYYDMNAEEFYTKDAFNQYGDVDQHWGKTWKDAFVFYEIDGKEFNYDVLQAMVDFSKIVKEKGATLYVSFPGFQTTSYGYCKKRVDFYEKELRKQPFTILGSPAAYVMPTDCIFDTPYHLNKKGADRRTQLLIGELKIAMKKDGIQ